MVTALRSRLQLYQITVIFSVLFALVGFSYNVWRMEVSEANSNTRTACFEMLLKLSELEQVVYAAHYDQDSTAGNPRTGWVIVGLVGDLAALTDQGVADGAQRLHDSWSAHWAGLPSERASADAVVTAIDSVRQQIKRLLASLD